MYKDKKTIEEEIRDIYENTLNINYKETILTENNLNILNAVIHKIRQDDLNAIKEMMGEEFYKLEEWYSSADKPRNISYFDANQKNINFRNNLLEKLNNLNK